jgi:hypothetical protein
MEEMLIISLLSASFLFYAVHKNITTTTYPYHFSKNSDPTHAHTRREREREREEKGNHFVVGRMQRPRRAMPWRTWRLHLALPFLSPLSGDACFSLSWLWEHDSPRLCVWCCLLFLCCNIQSAAASLYRCRGDSLVQSTCWSWPNVSSSDINLAYFY